MRIKWGKTYTVKHPTVVKDSEGVETENWTVSGQLFANIYPASGRVQAEIYGKRLNYMLNMLCQLESVTEGDGICVEVSELSDPDYTVIAVQKYSDHLLCTLESRHI